MNTQGKYQPEKQFLNELDGKVGDLLLATFPVRESRIRDDDRTRKNIELMIRASRVAAESMGLAPEAVRALDRPAAMRAICGEAETLRDAGLLEKAGTLANPLRHLVGYVAEKVPEHEEAVAKSQFGGQLPERLAKLSGILATRKTKDALNLQPMKGVLELGKILADIDFTNTVGLGRIEEYMRRFTAVRERMAGGIDAVKSQRPEPELKTLKAEHAYGVVRGQRPAHDGIIRVGWDFATSGEYNGPFALPGDIRLDDVMEMLHLDPDPSVYANLLQNPPETRFTQSDYRKSLAKQLSWAASALREHQKGDAAVETELPNKGDCAYTVRFRLYPDGTAEKSYTLRQDHPDYEGTKLTAKTTGIRAALMDKKGSLTYLFLALKEME